MTKLIAVDMDGTFLNDNKTYDKEKWIYYIYKIIFLCGSLKDHYYIGKGVQYYQNI